MSVIVLLFLFPWMVSALTLFLPVKKSTLKGRITIAVSFLLMAGSWYIFLNPVVSWQPAFPAHYPELLHAFTPFLIFSTEGASGILLIISGTMILLLAIGAHINDTRNPSEDHYYTWFLMGTGLCFALLTAAHIYMLLFLWGVTGIPLYMLVMGKTERLADTGKKTLILFGSAHGFMATGAVMAVALSGNPFINSIRIDTSIFMHRVSFLLLLSGGLMTVGIIPLHGWIISTARFASSRVIAFMPLVLMRFAGIYLLIKLCHDLFILDFYSKLILHILSSFTAILGLTIGFTAKQTLIKLIYIHIAAGGLALMGIATGNTAGLISAVFIVTAASAIMTIRILFYKYKPVLHITGQTKERGVMSVLSRMENSGYTDLYHVASKLVFSIHRPLSRLHDGVLQTYLVWVMAALVILFLLNGILYGH